MIDKFFLKQALTQAKIKRGFCSPNPAVGAIIVDLNNTILAKGYHHGSGLPHAEIDALKKLNFYSPQSTLYITLEPCSHWGKTPPCVDAIINSGIQRVVYAFGDPNPLVSGKGVLRLNEAGIKCDHIQLKEVDAFYESYHHWQLTKSPKVTAKIALSLNGAIADENGNPVRVTGELLSQLTHRLRKVSDAILTSIETVKHDDPQFNVRIKSKTFTKPVYVLDTHLKLPLSARLFKTAKNITVFHAANANQEVRLLLLNKGVRCVEVDETHFGLDLHQVVHQIGQDGVHDLWVEAGGKCFASFVRDQLLHRAYIYISLRWFKHGKIAFPMGISLDEMSQMIRWRQFGSDVMCDIRF